MIYKYLLSLILLFAVLACCGCDPQNNNVHDKEYTLSHVTAATCSGGEYYELSFGDLSGITFGGSSKISFHYKVCGDYHDSPGVSLSLCKSSNPANVKYFGNNFVKPPEEGDYSVIYIFDSKEYYTLTIHFFNNEQDVGTKVLQILPGNAVFNICEILTGDNKVRPISANNNGYNGVTGLNTLFTDCKINLAINTPPNISPPERMFESINQAISWVKSVVACTLNTSVICAIDDWTIPEISANGKMLGMTSMRNASTGDPSFSFVLCGRINSGDIDLDIRARQTVEVSAHELGHALGINGDDGGYTIPLDPPHNFIGTSQDQNECIMCNMHFNDVIPKDFCHGASNGIKGHQFFLKGEISNGAGKKCWLYE